MERHHRIIFYCYTCISIKYTAVNLLAIAQTRPLTGGISTEPQCSQGDVVEVGTLGVQEGGVLPGGDTVSLEQGVGA